MTLPRLFVSHDAGSGELSCLEFGRVPDGQPSERWVGVTDWLGLYESEPDRVAGFQVPDTSAIDLDAPELEALEDGPRFAVPALGLDEATVPETILAALAYFGGPDGVSSVNRVLFQSAAGEEGDEAIASWRACLESGDAMAHFGLGYTLLETGRTRPAYRHLRHYARLAPAEPWAWCWYAQAALAIGERAEARLAYEHALLLDDPDEPVTDAEERLAELL